MSETLRVVVPMLSEHAVHHPPLALARQACERAMAEHPEKGTHLGPIRLVGRVEDGALDVLPADLVARGMRAYVYEAQVT